MIIAFKYFAFAARLRHELAIAGAVIEALSRIDVLWR